MNRLLMTIAVTCIATAALAVDAQAAVVLGNSGVSATVDGTTTDTGNLSFDMLTGDFLVVAITAGGTQGNIEATLDYAGDTSFLNAIQGADKDNWTAIYYLTNPTSGSNTLSVMLTTDHASGDPLKDDGSDFKFGVYSLSNVDKANPLAKAQETLGNQTTTFPLLSPNPGDIDSGDFLVMANAARNNVDGTPPDWQTAQGSASRLYFSNTTAGNGGKSEHEVEHGVLVSGDLTDEDAMSVNDDLVLTTGNSDAGTYSAAIFNALPSQSPAVPSPTAVAVGLLGLAVLAGRRRRA